MSIWVALTVGAGIVFFLTKSRMNYLRLPEIPETTGDVIGDVGVIIPARNEEKNIARVVRSLGGARVMVVDDDSRDHTAELARGAGAVVIPAPPLPQNKLGKPNACLAGARATESKWLLFVDADTWYEPGFLGSMLRYAEAQGLDMASVFLKQEARSFWERMLLPYAFALYFCGVNARSVNDPESLEALANGQCLLFRRDLYESVGGHGAVADSIIEDVALARIAKQRKWKTRVLRAEHLGHVRMYDGLGAIWRGFQKNSFRFLLVNPLSGVEVITASILLTSYLPLLAWLLIDGHWTWVVLWAFLPSVSLLPWYGRFGSTLLAPVAIYLFQLIALNAMATVLLGGKTDWKGRRV